MVVNSPSGSSCLRLGMGKNGVQAGLSEAKGGNGQEVGVGLRSPAVWRCVGPDNHVANLKPGVIVSLQPLTTARVDGKGLVTFQLSLSLFCLSHGSEDNPPPPRFLLACFRVPFGAIAQYLVLLQVSCAASPTSSGGQKRKEESTDTIPRSHGFLIDIGIR